MELARDFPLFPLKLVALPGELIPLHIFEERYKTMIARCLEEPTEFGIVCADDDGLRETGCACEIAEVLERFEDGRINLVARGTRPFHIETEQADLPYPAGAVRFLDDAADEPDADLLAEVHEAYAELVRTATDRTPDLTEIAEMSAYAMAGTVEFAIDAKQELLEARSETARLEQLLALLRGAIRRLAFVERAQAVARSNGKVRLGPAPDELSS
jgi:Lon protease-like protein